MHEFITVGDGFQRTREPTVSPILLLEQGLTTPALPGACREALGGLRLGVAFSRLRFEAILTIWPVVQAFTQGRVNRAWHQLVVALWYATG